MRRRRSGHDPGRAAPRHPGDGMIAALVFDFDGLMVDTESPLVEAGPWFVLVFLAVLVLEWTLRRKVNLF